MITTTTATYRGRRVIVDDHTGAPRLVPIIDAQTGARSVVPRDELSDVRSITLYGSGG